jgi:hypothetical protein
MAVALRSSQESEAGGELVFDKYGDFYFVHRILSPTNISLNLDVASGKVAARVRTGEARLQTGEQRLVESHRGQLQRSGPARINKNSSNASVFNTFSPGYMRINCSQGLLSRLQRRNGYRSIDTLIFRINAILWCAGAAGENRPIRHRRPCFTSLLSRTTRCYQSRQLR